MARVRTTLFAPLGACHPARRTALCAIALVSLAGCQQKMADQPSYKDLQPCTFFSDGLSQRPPVAGTIARGQLPADIPLLTGRRVGPDGQPRRTVPTKNPPEPGTPAAAAAERAAYDDFVAEFPIPVNEEVLQHGYHRFMIYCYECHDPLGTGNGKIVERGYTPPPSYHIPRLRDAPVGHLFAVISEGYGSMPSHAAQIPVRDRWAIAAYVRALQASQHFSEAKLSNAMRREMAEQRQDANARERSP